MPYTPDATDVAAPTDTGIAATTAAAEFRAIKAYLATKLPKLTSGTYTPTLTNVANINTTGVFACQWMRVGDVVTVSGRIAIRATLLGVYTEVGISLPVASNFASAQQCGGAVISENAGGSTGGVSADLTNDRARIVSQNIADVASNNYALSFTYQVI